MQPAGQTNGVQPGNYPAFPSAEAEDIDAIDGIFKGAEDLGQYLGELQARTIFLKGLFGSA